MNIIDIAREIELKEKQSSAMGTNPFHWRPKECKEYNLPELKIPVVRSKACTKENIRQSTCVYTVVEKFNMAANQ